MSWQQSSRDAIQVVFRNLSISELMSSFDDIQLD